MTQSPETRIEWDIGTAYDLFISLSVLHEPEKFGLRGSWAAGVRSRLPAPERDLLQRAVPAIWPLGWVHSLPAPKDAATVLATLEATPPAERLVLMQPSVPDDILDLRVEVSARRTWSEKDQKWLADKMQEQGWKAKPGINLRRTAGEILSMWADAAGTGEGLLEALTCYYDEFFAEEEARIRPALETSLRHARSLAQTLPLPALLEELSQGVRVSPELRRPETVLAPSFWATPLLIFGLISEEQGIILFGARPADMSLVPGDPVPDALYQALKALADPTRLRILRYLSDEPLAPAELARRLRLRAPTVIHHLDALRLARLVVVSLEGESKRYTVRPGAVAAVSDLLNNFLEGPLE